MKQGHLSQHFTKVVAKRLSAVEADPNRIQTAQGNGAHPLRPASVRVEVNRPFVCPPPDLPDARCDELIFCQRFPLAALTEADHRFGCFLQVVHADGDDLFLCRFEPDSLMGRVA